MRHSRGVPTILRAAALALASLPSAVCAQEVSSGLYVHGADTPLTLYTGESGVDVALGYRFAPIANLEAIGAPAPSVIGWLNSDGDTSFPRPG